MPRHATGRHAFAAVALLGLLALRIWLAFMLRVNSDEPQHLHTVWCWTQGILPYRDVFDNHAPLFHILYAPVLALLGERADIVPLMRLAVIPWYGLTLWFVYLLGSRLYDRRIGWIAAGLTALYPTFFTRSVEFRPDDAWAAAWIGALVVAVSSRPTPKRALECGMAAGLAIAFSIKSAVLIMAALVAAGMILLILTLQRRRPDWVATLRIALATAVGGAILPTTIAIAFAAAGAWEGIRYCLFVHNAATGLGRWSHAGWHVLAFPLLLPPLAWLMQRMLRERSDPLLPALRAWVLGSGLIYLALRASYQPLLDKQDLLPLVPMLAPAVAALLVAASRWSAGQNLRGRCAVALVLAFEVAVALDSGRPWLDEAHQFSDELRTLLRLSRPYEYVMDDKAESIFRPRPSYWVLENVTLHRLAHGLIPDDIPQRLSDDHVAVGVFERERGADLEFVRRNYVTVAPHVEVAGKVLGTVGEGQKISFDVALPNRYALIARDGHAEGSLDGLPYTAPRDLATGPHSFIAAHADAWAVVWDRAGALGYSPFQAPIQ